MNITSSCCPDDKFSRHEFAALLLPYFDILATRSDSNSAGSGVQTNEKLNYEEVFGSGLKTLDEILVEMEELLKSILDSYRTIIWLIDPESGKLKIHNPQKRHFTQPMEQEVEVGTSIAAYVTMAKTHIKLSGDINIDCRFPLGNEDNRTKAIICVPILKPNEEVIGAIECYRLTETEYSADDLHTLMTLMIWIGAVIDQQTKRDQLQGIQDMNNMYMGFLQEYFSKDVDLCKLLYKVFDCTKTMVDADRGFIAVVPNNNNPLNVDIFDEIPGKQTMKMKSYDLDPERGCASICIRNRQIVNIVNPERKLYDLELDRYIGTPTTSILCIPVMDKSQILGCIQLFNKKNGHFDATDELKISRIIVYFSLLLHGIRMDKKINHNNDSNNVMHEMLSYEMNKIIKDSHIDENIEVPEDFDRYSFNPTDPALLPSYSFYIFKSLIDPEFFDSEKYCDFIKIVHRTYRQNPFHNFEIIYLSLHCAYLILKSNIDNFEPCEVIALLITSLCNSIDHRGVTNSYLADSKHPIFSLHNGHSCWQRHCLWLTKQIIKRIQLFSGLMDYHVKQIDELLENGYLALDYPVGLKQISKLHPIVKNKAFHWSTPGHRVFIQILILFAVDVVVYTKPYDSARRAIQNLVKEHFHEGQTLKEMGIVNAILIDDPSKRHQILDKQVAFMKTIVLPIYELCTFLLDNCDELLERATNLLRIVEDLISTSGQKVWYPDDNYGKFDI